MNKFIIALSAMLLLGVSQVWAADSMSKDNMAKKDEMAATHKTDGMMKKDAMGDGMMKKDAMGDGMMKKDAMGDGMMKKDEMMQEEE